ncbi:isocitrate lyase/phosphoenolpyruvate mutase family protein [Ekhidna sp.]|uniref:isocitrate lyase/phosphoenolpyruvate mutase family protein n=1 Tax=Ekhidna sp. TaxID=2608089 RepID=UPI003CCBE6F8
MKNESSVMNAAVEEAENFFNSSRFKGVKRLYTARQIAEQQGTLYNDYSIAKHAAHNFYKRLRELYNEKKSITTFGPYSPGQAVMMKRSGIEGIYLGGWATSAKGSTDEDPGADVASYPLSQVPNEAASIVRALLAADKNQTYARHRMNEAERSEITPIDYSPYIIADADTGHGGDAQIRNLVRRFVEAGVPGYHIEDQKPGTKKCGHLGGKVLVSCDEQIKRLNAARFQLDLMRVEGIIVARTDAEAATLLETISDERDHPFVLGATNPDVPSYKSVILGLHQVLREKGVPVFGHELYAARVVKEETILWLKQVGVLDLIEENLSSLQSDHAFQFEPKFDEIHAKTVEKWEEEAAVMTISEAAIEAIEIATKDGLEIHLQEGWKDELKGMSFEEVKAFCTGHNVTFRWDCEVMRSPEGYYQIRGGIPFAIAKSLAIAPFADILWMETKTADLADAKLFAEAIHKVYPDQMLAYNLSPSFNWDSTGMTEEEMKAFPEELAKMGFVFNFITYGGHQIDGLAADEFSNSLLSEGMLALAKVQRKFRLLDSPYKTPQTHVGGPRMDGALAASSGRTATTKAMGKGSTQFQHLVNIELPTKVLAGWVKQWAELNEVQGEFKVKLRPQNPGSNVLELMVLKDESVISNVVFSSLMDRNDQNILSIRDQNTFEAKYRRKRLMTLQHLFLLNRFKSNVVHYLTPTEDNVKQCEGMAKRDIYKNVHEEVGQLIVAEVDKTTVNKFLDDPVAIEKLLEVKEEKIADLA